MGSCAACSAPREGAYCSACGAASTGSGVLLAVLPASLAGAVVGIIGAIVAHAVTLPEGNGFFEGIARLVLMTTLPFAEYGFCLLGGIAGCFALRATTGRAVGLLAGTLVVLLSASLTSAYPIQRLPIPLSRIALDAALAFAGVMIAWPLASRPTFRARFAKFYGWLPGTPALRSALGTLLTVGALLALYYLTVAVVAVVIVLVIVGIVLKALFGGQSGGGDVVIREKPRRVLPWGHPFTERDQAGRYAGRVDERGERRDERGRYRGQIEDDGTLRDARGGYEGRIDESGKIYGDRGQYQGEIDKDGQRRDARGKVIGRVEPEE